MKTLARKTWQRIVALFLVVVSLFGLLNLPPITAWADGETYTLVTDASALAVGDSIIIAAKDSDFALSTTQNSNNRGQAAITKNGDTATFGADVQVLTLEAGKTDGTFAFNTGSGYLYAASSSKNHLRTETTLSANSSWTIAITDGTATIKAQGNYTRNLMQYNKSSSIFSAYSSAQQDICIYKLVENTSGGEDSGSGETPSCEHTNKEAIGEAKDATCTENGITAGEKCVDCGEEITAQETLPALGHSYVDGVCSVCSEKQPTKITVEKDSFVNVDTYGWYEWKATTTTGENISGYGYTTKNNDSIQVNGSKGGDYIYNTTALPGAITSVTLTKASGTDRNFDVLTSDTPFDSATAASLKGQATDAKKLVTTEGVTWTFETNHKYFAIVIVDSSAAYLSSIEIAYKVCPHTNKVAIGEAKDATCTEDGITAGEKCADCGEIFTAQETIDALGHDYVGGVCTRCEDAQCTEHVWVDGDVITEPTCTATGLQKQYCEVCGQPGEDKEVEIIPHTEVIDEAVAATCTATGLTEGSHCSVCEEVLVAQEETPLADHDYVDGKCTVCGDVVVNGPKFAEFQFGDNGEATHKDGSAISEGEEYADGEYTLKLESIENVYDGGFDAKGNSALKLGTSKATGSFTFTVYDSVNTVVIYVAGYKANTAKINVNGTEYLITSKSDEGDYTKVVVDTSENKTVTLTTISGGVRAMINSIEFWGLDIQANVVLTSNLAIQFAVENVDGITEVRINDSVVAPSGTKDDTYNVYAYRDIEPQKIGDAVVLTVYRGETCIATLDYNVKDYCDQIINGDYSEKLKNLCKAILDYGAAAQNVEGYKTDALVNESVDGEVADAEMDANDYDEVACEGATVVVDQVALTLTDSITMKYMLTGCEAGMTAKIYFGETEVDSLQVTADGTCVVSYAFAGAEDFGKVVTIKVFNENNEQVSNAVSYSVKSYCVDLSASNNDYKNLAQAIYNYVTYIDAYVATQA